MLFAERADAILQFLQENRTATVQQLAQALDASESTIRRDLLALDRQGRLTRVHGGATLPAAPGVQRDEEVAARTQRNLAEKRAIARAAAALLLPDDFVFIDAGTTTALLAELAAEPGAVYVTNALGAAAALAARGLRVHLPGGQLKAATGALVGEETLCALSRYHFTKGFFGANGVSLDAGFTTPDPGEGMVKQAALRRCQKAYILADGSKIGQISPVQFATLEEAELITNGPLPAALRGRPGITEVQT